MSHSFSPTLSADDSKITGPMSLRSYYAVTPYTDPKTKFSFAEGAVIQVLQKDTSGMSIVFASSVNMVVL